MIIYGIAVQQALGTQMKFCYKCDRFYNSKFYLFVSGEVENVLELFCSLNFPCHDEIDIRRDFIDLGNEVDF